MITRQPKEQVCPVCAELEMYQIAQERGILRVIRGKPESPVLVVRGYQCGRCQSTWEHEQACVALRSGQPPEETLLGRALCAALETRGRKRSEVYYQVDEHFPMTERVALLQEVLEVGAGLSFEPEGPYCFVSNNSAVMLHHAVQGPVSRFGYGLDRPQTIFDLLYAAAQMWVKRVEEAQSGS